MSSSIICPYCQHGSHVKNPKPGKFTPKCPKCGKQFIAIFSADPVAAPEVRALKADARSETAPPKPSPAVQDTNATGEFLPSDLADDASASSAATKPAEVANPGATGDYTPAGETRAPEVTTASRRDDDDEVDIPKTLGGYQVVKELGRGGMGAVFLARQMSLDRTVALKVMKAKWAQDPKFVARFAREAYAAA